MTEYVAGFLFSEDKKYVALVEKQKPEWMKGKWNAIGGKIEEGESPRDAMVREFQEETGVLIEDWKALAGVEGSNFKVYFFEAYDTKVFDVKTIEEEHILLWPVEDVFYYHTRLMSNLRLLISLALDTSGISLPVVFYDGIPNK